MPAVAKHKPLRRWRIDIPAIYSIDLGGMCAKQEAEDAQKNLILPLPLPMRLPLQRRRLRAC